jgi:CBS domain-containing protein
MKVSELMTPTPLAVTSRDTVLYAAELMRGERIGSLPVVRDLASLELVGIITDRDITVRCVACGDQGVCEVVRHMTPIPLQTVHPDDDVSEVIRKMEAAQVRRIPVVREHNKLVGIVTQADLARRLGPTHPLKVEEVLERISKPAGAQT